jgi:acyl-CoA synthetase (NDP forming)
MPANKLDGDAVAPEGVAFPDLQRFFTPQSFALVGATADLTKFGGRALKLTQDFGFSGRLYPVNPRAGEILGHKAYATVRDLPEAPDHVGVVVAADRVLAVLDDCAARGAKFVTVLTSGFAETGTEHGRLMQAQIGEFSRRTGVRVMGPNCNGFINFVDRMVFASTATVSSTPPPTGFVSVAAQSGGLGMVNAMWRAQQAGLGVNHVVTCGNDADLDILDFANFMVEDAATRVIMLIAERIPSGAKLFAVAEKAANAAKPILIVKLGRTEEGRRAAQSHTGAMTGSDAVHDAAFRQAGIIRCADCNEMYEAAMLLGGGRIARGRGASGLSISGGNVVLLTDLGAGHAIRWPDYTGETHARLAALMPSYGRVSNPADLTTAAIGSADMFQRVLDAISADANVDVMIPIVTFGTRADIDYTLSAAQRSSKPYALLWNGGCVDDPALSAPDLVRQGLPVYRDTLECVRAVGRAMNYGAYLERRHLRATLRRPVGADVEAARAVLMRCGMTLSEQQSKTVLAAYGFFTPRERLAVNAADAQAIAREFARPVALKISSPDIPHKTEAGGVCLDLVDAASIASAFELISANARAFRPAARLDGVLVQEMAAAGLELVLGITRDAVFGPVIAVGIGGIHVEILGDMVYRVPPVSLEDARAMLAELRAYRLFEGVRGEGERDIDAVAAAIERLSWFALDFGDAIVELDINPLIVGARGAGVTVADALIVRAHEARPGQGAGDQGAGTRGVGSGGRG